MARRTIFFLLLSLLLLLLLFTKGCLGLFLSGTESSHLRYPRLNFCQNSSIALDFKTTTSSEALLLYSDQVARGRSNYIEISYDASGHVTALVREETRRKYRIGPYLLNDGRWHRIELRKVEWKIFLLLDGIATSAAYAYGESDAGNEFASDDLRLPSATGHRGSDGHVYVGGLPAEIRENPGLISLPSSALKRSLNGYVRNVIYRNCTCQTARVRHSAGSGFVDHPLSKCDNGTRVCPKGCTCLVADNDKMYECDCSERHCVDSIITHYSIPFDVTGIHQGMHQPNILLNETDVTAIIVTSPPYDPNKRPPLNSKQVEKFFSKHGVKNDALLLNQSTCHVQFNGLDHSSECFGDLSLCNKGYTVMAWLFITMNCSTPATPLTQSAPKIPTELVIMSSGSLLFFDAPRSFGMKLAWDPLSSKLFATVNTSSGLSSRVKTKRMTSQAWYHVTFTWSEQTSKARLYVDGMQVDEAPIVVWRGKEHDEGSMTSPFGYDVPSFLIGRPWSNESSEMFNYCQGGFKIDEFNYWSEEKTELDLLEFGEEEEEEHFFFFH